VISCWRLSLAMCVLTHMCHALSINTGGAFLVRSQRKNACVVSVRSYCGLHTQILVQDIVTLELHTHPSVCAYCCVHVRESSGFNSFSTRPGVLSYVTEFGLLPKSWQD